MTKLKAAATANEFAEEVIAHAIVKALRSQAKTRHGTKSLTKQNSYAAFYLARIVAEAVTSPREKAFTIVVDNIAELMPEMTLHE